MGSAGYSELELPCSSYALLPSRKFTSLGAFTPSFRVSVALPRYSAYSNPVYHTLPGLIDPM